MNINPQFATTGTSKPLHKFHILLSLHFYYESRHLIKNRKDIVHAVIE